MTSNVDPNWTPYNAVSSVVADDGRDTARPAPRARHDARGDGDTNGTTHHNYPDGWRVVNGGPTGHTEPSPAETPQTTTPIVVPGPAEGDPVVVPAEEAAQTAPEAPRRTVRDTLVDLYGNPLDAFYRAQPSIYERGQYSKNASWTKKDGALRKGGIWWWNCIGSPGVVTGYLYSEANSRPAHWLSAFVIGGGWHMTMIQFNWHLGWGWFLTWLTFHVTVARTAYVIGKRPPKPYGTDSESGSAT